MSYARSKSRQRSRSRSASSSSSSRSRSGATDLNKGFKELEMARRRKELEELLTLPTKSILKKRSSEDSPSVRVSLQTVFQSVFRYMLLLAKKQR